LDFGIWLQNINFTNIIPNRMIKSPLRYPGGKSRAVKQIAALMPPFAEYREPFVGGGSVFAYVRQQFPERKFWVNDLYPALYDFWVVCQQDVAALIAQIRAWRQQFPVGKDLHRFLSANRTEFNQLERAAAFFIFNRITFSGTTESGGYSEQAFRGRFTESSIARVQKFAPLLTQIKISNEDYQSVIEAPGEDVWLFLDPPYHTARKSALYGKNGDLHKDFDHERLAAVLQRCPHRWLMTCDDSPYIRDLYAFARLKAWDLTYGMRNVNKTATQIGKELFISNYEF